MKVDLLRIGEGQRLKGITGIVEAVNTEEPHVRSLDDDALRAKTAEFRARLREGASLEDLLIEAFAVVREAARRVLNQRAYDEQVMAGVALHFGWIAEMKTGEGKTLAAILPAYLNALSGKGVHIMTANDYLVIRDYLTMGPLFRALGMEVGAVHPGTTAYWMKRNGYNADVTYGTVTEFGFDYLRDNIALDPEQIVQRGLSFALIDEVDAVLIDEARTPLVLSGSGSIEKESLASVDSFVRSLLPGEDYEVDLEHFVVHPTDAGVDKAEHYFGVENLYEPTALDTLHRFTQALRAHALYVRDKDYLVRDDRVEIIDANTGRVLDGRRWNDGLHQALEVKEGVSVLVETSVLATITVQYLTKLYDKVAGMSGTAKTDEEEFGSIYQLPIVEIPTHLPVQRVDHPELIYRTQEEKFAAILEEVKRRHGKGQPLLVGTASVERSDYVSRLFTRAGIDHHVLNAKDPTAEAAVIAQSGRVGAVTVATNMAGRGVDILLGGDAVALAQAKALAQGHVANTPEGQAAFDVILEEQRLACREEGDVVRQHGGLFVLGSERHGSRRVDDQLRGRAGRQGDPGESQYYLSLEDEIMEVFDAGRMKAAMARVAQPGQPLTLRIVSSSVRKAQEASEARDAKSREQQYRFDAVLHEQRNVLYTLRRRALLNTEPEKLLHDALRRVVDGLVATYCADEFFENWDVQGLSNAVRDLLGDVHDDEITLLEADVNDRLLALLTRPLDGVVDEARATLYRRSLLEALDVHWRAHLLDMAELKEGINWRQHARLAPLVQWSTEGYYRFEDLLDEVDATFVRAVLRSLGGA